MQISKIQINSCPDLVLAINLDKVDPGVVQTLEIKNVQKIKITSVRFDPRYENQQRLKVKFSNVVKATIQDVEVTETLEVKILNISVRTHSHRADYSGGGEERQEFLSPQLNLRPHTTSRNLR